MMAILTSLIGFKSILLLLLNCMSYLYILEIKPLLVASFGSIFSQSIGCLFILLMVSSAVQKLPILIRYHLITFTFISFFFFKEWFLLLFLLPWETVQVKKFDLYCFLELGGLFKKIFRTVRN